jgi:hypothetical protein
MTWNYRIIYKEGGFQIHRAFYDGEKVVGITEDSSRPYGETFADFSRDLKKFYEAVQKPVLDYHTLVPREPIHEDKAD